MIKHEPLNTLHMISTPFSKNFFQAVVCLPFCQLIEKIRYNATLTKLLGTQIKMEKIKIAGVYFTISADIVAKATSMPNHGEK